MALIKHTQQHTAPKNTVPLSPTTRQGIAEEKYTGIAAAVAQLMKLMIREMVEAAMASGLEQIRAEVTKQSTRLGEAEQQISTAEDDIQEQQVLIDKLNSNMQSVLQKLYDLENRSRRNNLRIKGLPETHKATDLIQI